MTIPILHTGEMLILFIQFRGEFAGRDFDEVVLLTTDGDTIESLNISDIGDGVYSSSFVTPSQPFQLQIIGRTNSSGNPISRISTNGVQVATEEIGKVQLLLR